MGELVNSMKMLGDVFNKHAGADKKLDKHELGKLLREQFGCDPSDNPQLTKMFNDLDADKNGTVEFKEFVVFVAALATILNV